jgi:C-methyltransferase C-terminal domain/Putative zinc binding domain/Methyltransferase domain
MSVCRVCSVGPVEGTLALGRQPVSSHFAARGQHVVTHDLSLGVCLACGVVQLVEPFPFRDLVPPYDWITYREPEEHLDAVVDMLLSRVALPADAVILGLSFKDRSTLDRLKRLGYPCCHLIDVIHDLGSSTLNANIESVPGLLTPDIARRIRAERGPAQLIIARHVVEHAEVAGRFLAALSDMLAPRGAMVLEVPDCTANLQRQDYTMLWEEHVTYFTPETLPQILAAAGLTAIGLDIHPFPFEDVLVLTAVKGHGRVEGTDIVPTEAVVRNVALTRRYAKAFESWTEQYRQLCRRFTRDGRKLALYGAGHLSAAFVNFHGLGEYFAFVVDDTPQKQGLHLPGCGLPIVAREALNSDQIAACLMGFAPQIEDKVMANNAGFQEAGGSFYSIFADSKRSIRNVL